MVSDAHFLSCFTDVKTLHQMINVNCLMTKVCLVKAMVFAVVMYRCESWTIKKLSTEELMLSNRGVGEDS